jgi:hypothetical protein
MLWIIELLLATPVPKNVGDTSLLVFKCASALPGQGFVVVWSCFYALVSLSNGLFH